MPISFGNSELILFLLLLLASGIIVYLMRKYYIDLNKDEKHFDSILNNINDGVYRTDLDGNFIWCSESAMKMLGVKSPDDIKGANVKDFYVSAEQLEGLMAKLKENGQVTNYEAILQQMDGSQIVISCNCTYWRDRKGNIIGIEGVFGDITKEKRAIDALVESEEKYRSVVEGASEAIFSLNYEGTFLFMNKIAAQRLGGTAKNFIGKTMWDIFPKHIADSQVASIKKIFDSGKGFSTQSVTIINEKKFKYNTNLQPIKDASGKVISVLGVAHDITNLAQSQKDLKNEREFVSSLLETANSLIICLDKYAKIKVFNKEIEKLTGYTADEVIGKSWPDIFLPKDHYHHKIDNFEKWVKERPSDQLESQLKTKSGELRTILWSNSTLFHPDSDDFTAIAIGHDITERKKVEQAQIESETRFKESLKYSQTVLYRLNLKTNTYDYISDVVYDIIGYTPEEVIEMGADGINALVHPDDRDLQVNYRYKLINSDKGDQTAHYTESRIKGKNGKYIWSGDTHALVRGADGEPLYIIGCARDITQQKKTEIRQKARIELLNNLRVSNDIDTCLGFGCQAILDAELFERAVLTMHNDKKEIVNIGYVGLDKEIVEAAQNAPAPGDEVIKKMTQEKFRISNSYFVPAESAISFEETKRYILQKDLKNRDIATWQSGDELFVPIVDEGEKYDGWLSVDTPFDHDRPAPETVRILEEIVDIVTQKIREIKAQSILNKKHNDLRASEEKYHNLIDSNPDAIVIFQNRRVRFINPAYEKLLGYSLEELSGEDSFVKTIHRDEIDSVLRRIEDGKSGKKLSKAFTVTLISKDGREIQCETSNTEIQYQGQPAEFITMRDITERKQIEKEREDSDRRYQELFNSMLEGFGLVDENEVIQFCNPAFLSIFEVESSDELIGRSILDFIPENQKEIILSQTKKRKENIASQYEHKIITAKGNKKTIYLSASPRFDDSNKFIGTFGVLFDITKQKKIMDDLVQSEVFSEAIIKYSPIGVSVRSRTGKLLSANDAWIKIWGHTEEEINDFSTREKAELKFDYCDAYLGSWLPELKRVYEEGGYLRVPDVKVINPKKNAAQYVSQHFYAIKDASDHVDRVVILTEDITERKIAEDKIKAINVEKLEQAKRIAGTFAHEIRNALFPASASLNRLKFNFQTDGKNSEELKKYSSIAERSITRAADITGLISSYTKLDTEQMPERVNLNEIIQELLNNNQLRLLENNVKVNTSTGRHCMVKSNRRQLLLAFNNLLLNSIDALAENGKSKNREINIQISANDDCSHISFQDNGSGIPAEYHGRIFEPFFSKKSENGGTGLGLAMTKRIIEMYGGTIAVNSEPKVGTTFKIVIKNYKAEPVDKSENL